MWDKQPRQQVCLILDIFWIIIHEHNAVPGELPSKFTTSEKPYIFYFLQIIECGKNVLRVLHSIVQESTQK